MLVYVERAQISRFLPTPISEDFVSNNVPDRPGERCTHRNSTTVSSLASTAPNLENERNLLTRFYPWLTMPCLLKVPYL
jgi:hypothetical protein